MNSSRRWPWIAPILLYAASALEMIIMVTPFAAYFYSVYTPLIHVGPPDAQGRLAVSELTMDQFYPDFARILF